MIVRTDFISADERARLAVLDAVSRCPLLWDHYVLKGGLALRYAYHSLRRSYDLDFTSARVYAQHMTPATEELLFAFSSLLDESLAETAAEYGFPAMRTHWRQLSEDLPILYARIGYSEEQVEGDEFEEYLEMQVTLSETVYEAMEAETSGIRLHVPVLEDILAEKLKALLQQVLRGVNRASDLYDIWYYTAVVEHRVDTGLVTRCFMAKTPESTGMGRITKVRFAVPEVLEHASKGYGEISEHLVNGAKLPSAEDAYRAVLRFVNRLDLPEV